MYLQLKNGKMVYLVTLNMFANGMYLTILQNLRYIAISRYFDYQILTYIEKKASSRYKNYFGILVYLQLKFDEIDIFKSFKHV